MSNVSKPSSYQLSQKQQYAVVTAGTAGLIAAGPIGAAGAAIGMAAGCAAANFLGWEDSSQSSSGGS